MSKSQLLKGKKFADPADQVKLARHGSKSKNTNTVGIVKKIIGK